MSQNLLQFIQSIIDHESDDTLYFYPEVDSNGQIKLAPSDDLLKLFTQVYKEGVHEGYNEGFDDGYHRGFSIGYDSGLQDGRKEECKDWTELFDLVKLKQQLK